MSGCSLVRNTPDCNPFHLNVWLAILRLLNMNKRDAEQMSWHQTAVSYCLAVCQQHRPTTSGTNRYTLFDLEALYMCVLGCFMQMCPWQTGVVNYEFCVKLVTLHYVTWQTRFWVCQDEHVAFRASKGCGFFFQIFTLFRHGTSLHFASAGNIISSCFPLFCHDHIPISPILSVTVGGAEVCFCPVSYHENDQRTSFLSECSLRGPKV